MLSLYSLDGPRLMNARTLDDGGAAEQGGSLE